MIGAVESTIAGSGQRWSFWGVHCPILMVGGRVFDSMIWSDLRDCWAVFRWQGKDVLVLEPDETSIRRLHGVIS
jgi:hypothetical protein